MIQIIEYLDRKPDFNYLELWGDWYSKDSYLIKNEKMLIEYLELIINNLKIDVLNISEFEFDELYPYNGYLYFIIKLRILDKVIEISLTSIINDIYNRGRISIFERESGNITFTDKKEDLIVKLSELLK